MNYRKRKTARKMNNHSNKIKRIINQSRNSILPPQKLLPSEFAETYLVLPDGASAGQKIRLYSFQREMLDIIDDPQYRKVVYKTSAQIAKTTILNSALFYWMYTDSSNIGIAQATGNELKQWKAGKIDKTIEQVSVLNNLITDKNDKRYANNASQIQLRDGNFLYFMSLGSPNHLRGKTLKRIILDEVSAVDLNDPEGNPIRLAEQRITDFRAEGKVLISSTPTFSGDAIDIEFQNSDQRHYHVKCIHCQHEYELLFENIHFEWEQIGNRKLPDPKTAKLHCPDCHEPITEAQRVRMVSKGFWVRHRPEITDTAGFYINRLYSPNSTIQDIISEFRLAWYEYNNQSFYNTVLGLHYSELQQDLEIIKLENLRDDSFDIENIPDEVLAITIGCDQQQDRLEATVLGFNDKELFVLGHKIFYGINCEVKGDTAYDQLLAFVKSNFRTVSGRKVKVLKAFIDSGNGRATNTVHAFCQRDPVLEPIKGSGSRTIPMFQQSTSKGQTFFNLNVHELKTWIRSLVINAVSENPDDAPLKVLFSHDLPDDYFEQLISEELKRKGDGYSWNLKKGHKRNEALDCLGYSLACMKYSLSKLTGHPFKELRQYASKQELKTINTTEINTPIMPEIKTKTQRRNSTGRSWFG